MTGFSLVPAVYLVLHRAGPCGQEVLLQLRQHTGFRDGYWACGAAGHVERGESVHTTVLREAQEELGITLRATDLQPLAVLQRSEGTGRAVDERVDFFFTSCVWHGTPRAVENKSGGLLWAQLDELADLDHPVVPHERQVLEAWRNGTLTGIMVAGLPPGHEIGTGMMGAGPTL